MTIRIRHRLRTDDGFTLVEILMVIIIAGLLAALALPAFLGQRDKATDAGAKVDARTAETAMEVYRTDNDDSYACGTDAQCIDRLRRIEDSVPETGLAVSGEDGSGSADADDFRVTADGGDDRKFWIAKRPGHRQQGCALNGSASHGGCRTAGGALDGSW